MVAPVATGIAKRVEDEIAHARYAEGISLLNTSTSSDPRHDLLRAKALYGLERFGAAMNEVSDILDAKSDDATRTRARALKVRLMSVMARTEDALAAAIDFARDAEQLGMLEEAVDGHTEAAWLYGRTRCRPLAEARLARAREIAEKWRQKANPVIDIVGRDIDLIEAFVLMQFDERPKAREAYERAGNIGGDSADAFRIRRASHVGLARIHYLLGEFDAAHRALDTLKPFAASDLRSRRALIDILSAQKRWADVAATYAELRQASPKSDYAESDEVSRALALYRAGDFDGAKTAFATIVANADDVRARKASEARSVLQKLSRDGARDLPKKRLYAFPSVAQLRNHCGPASCELYLRFFGISAEQIEIARSIKVPDGGTPVYRMKSYLEKAGFHARRIEADLPRLRALIDRDIPVILEEDYSSSRHVAVAIGYDDARGILEVQDPMTHAVRETTYEELEKIQAFSNAGALIGVPANRPEMLKALDDAGAIDCEYISLVDRAWALYDEENFELADKLVQNSLTLRRDYELSWIYQFQRAMRDVGKNPTADNRVRLHRIVAEAQAIWPDDEWPQTLAGDVAYSENRFGEALSLFEKARDRDPNDPSNWSKIADCQLALGDLPAAKSSLISCLARDPSHIRGAENLAHIHAEQGDFARGAMWNDIGLSQRSKNPFNHGVHRTIALGRRNYAAAIADWEKIRELDPARAARSLISHVRVLCKVRKFEEAEKLLRETVASDAAKDLKTDAAIEIGYVLFKSGQWEKAIAAADELWKTDKDGCIAPAQRGGAKLGMGDFDGGMADIEESLKRFPAFAWGLHKKGRALVKKDVHRAIGCLAAAVVLSPDTAEYRYDFGIAMEEIRCSAASIHLKKAAESGDLDEAQLTRIGALLVSMDGGRNAHLFFQSLERSFPSDLAIRRAHAKLLLETVWMPGAGLDALDAIARIAPEDPFGRLGRGISKLDRSLEDEAEGEKMARAAIADLDADPATAKLIFPRQLLATYLASIAQHSAVLDLLQKSAGDYIDARMQVASLAALDRFDEAETVAANFEKRFGKNGQPSPSGAMLRFKIAEAKLDHAQAFELAKAAGKLQGERGDDGRLDDWEVEQFKCLLALGKTDEAISFGLAQAGDGASLGRLAYAAMGQRNADVAKRLAQDALKLDPNEAGGYYVLARIAELAGEVDEARRLFERAGKSAPGWHAWSEELARFSLAHGDVKSAETFGQETMKRRGHVCFTALGLVAETHLVAGRVNDARALADRARRFASTQRSQGQDVHGLFALLDRRPDRARQCFDGFFANPLNASSVNKKRVEQMWGAQKFLA